MELIRGLHNLRDGHRGCVATIGNFDGVHRGHQAVIAQLAEKGAELNLPTVVIVFEPQPLEYFRPDLAPARLTRLREKLLALKQYCPDRVLCIEFDRRFADLTHEQFVQKVLVDGLGVRHLVVGDDFHFGKDRKGDFAYLTEAGQQLGFEVVHTDTYIMGEERVSSTRIRVAMQQGNMELAESLLGREYVMSGRVVHGQKLGRELGFPTANIHIHRKASPLQGIFVVTVNGIDAKPLQGVASLGNRPTVDGTKTILEVFLFDFNRDIYGRHVDVRFLHKLRDEEKYDDLETLKIQIQKDVDNAKAYFAASNTI